MSKITFRADEELVERIEARDASKSEIMREALREYLDGDSSREAADARATSAPRGHDRDAYADPLRSSASHATSRESVADGNERRTADVLDAVLTERVDELVSERLAAREARRREREAGRAQDVNVNVTLESDAPVRNARADANANGHTTPSDNSSDARANGATSDRDAVSEIDAACGQCGESLSADHVYCPNCGEKASRRVFCECGDEVRSDWGFCPGCGRRTPAADVLDRS